MKNCVKRIGIAFVAALLMCLASTVVWADDTVRVMLDGIQLAFDAEPVIVESRTMVPMRAVFELYGAEVFWDEGTEIVTAVNEDVEVVLQIDSKDMTVNDRKLRLDVAPILSEDRTMVPLRAVSEAFGSDVDWDPDERIVIITSPAEENPTMSGTLITDDYRYDNYDGVYNGVSIFDRDKTDYFGMELLNISPESGEEYAEIVNGMAEELENVRVFCGIAPTAAEFYATKAYKTNYLASISHIYNRLSDRVIPLNIEKAMMENADKYIYFRTDHHWTHLGSYYAYSEFCRASGNVVPDLETFQYKTVNNYLGSWGKVTVNTDGYGMLNQSRDTIEVYLPQTDYVGGYYDNMSMTDRIKDIQLIKPEYDGYVMFIEGDNPLTYFHTDAGNGKSVCIIKESYGNAFSTWLVNNYENVYILDYRLFNGHSENNNKFSIGEFYELHPFDDLIILSYPYTILADDLRSMFGEMWRKDYKDVIGQFENSETDESPFSGELE